MLAGKRRRRGEEPRFELPIREHNGDPHVRPAGASSFQQMRPKLGRAVVVGIKHNKDTTST